MDPTKIFSHWRCLLIILIFALNSHAQTFKNSDASCENGECIQPLVDKLINVGSAYQEYCLRPGLKHLDMVKFHQEQGLSEECWLYITQYQSLESKLQNHQVRLEARLDCQGKDCVLNAQEPAPKNEQQQFSCTPQKKQEISHKCGTELNCVLASSVFSLGTLGIGGYAAESFLSGEKKLNECHLGDDSCVSRLGLAFMRATMTFIDGAWDLLKLAGKATSNKVSELWSWMKEAEDQSSTAQLALAKASEDPGFFDLLLKDFPGTMSKIWQAFVAALKEWFKSNIFCQQWSGRPHLSQCLEPMDSFDCMPCKTMVTGLCSISGALVAEVVPAFLTGGLLTAAKHGAQGATKLSKLFTISDKTRDALKNSSLGKKARDNLKIDQALKSTVALKNSSLLTINKYLLSPLRSSLKGSYTALNTLVRQGRIFVLENRTGKILVFPGTILKTAFNVVVYPIDNPMTTFAFNAGSRTFDKVFKYGPPQLTNKTVVTGLIIEKEKKLEDILIQTQLASARGDVKKVIALEEEFIHHISRHRPEVVRKLLPREDLELSEIIRGVYPELRYGELAKQGLPQRVLKAEKELYLEITSLPAGATKERLERAFSAHVNQQVRSQILKQPFFMHDTPASKLIPSGNATSEFFLAPSSRGAFHVIKKSYRSNIVSKEEFSFVSEVDNFTKLHLSKRLNEFTLKPNHEFKIRIQQNPEGRGYLFEVHGLNNRSSQQLVKSLHGDDSFIHGINGQFKLQRTELNIRVRAGESGVITMEDLNIHGQLSSLESPYLTPVDVTEALRRGASPAIRSGNAVRNELEKEKDNRKK